MPFIIDKPETLSQFKINNKILIHNNLHIFIIIKAKAEQHKYNALLFYTYK